MLDEILAHDEIPDGWQQGRGTFGGLVLGLLTRRAEACANAPERALRALSGEIIGPIVPGPVTITTEILRAGTGATTVAARLVQGDGVQAHAVAVFGKARTTFASPVALTAPSYPPWREVPVADLSGPVPVFTQQVELRALDLGPLVAGGWVRFREPGRTRDAAYTIAMIDCWWPAMLSPPAVFRPVATLTFAFERVSDLAGLDPDAPLAYRGTILAGADGYAIESRELWGEDGRLVALNQQTIVVMA